MKTDRRFRNRKLLDYSKRTADSLALGFLFTILTVGLDLLGPYIIGLILDGELIEGIGPRDPAFYFMLVAAYGVITLVGAGGRYINIYFFNKTANRVSQYIQEDVFAHIQKLPIGFFDKLPVGQVVSRITNDTSDVRVLFRVVLSQLTMAGIYVVGIYIALFSLDYRLGLLALIPVPPVALVFVHFKNKSKEFNYAFRRYLSELNANLNENIAGMEIIHAFNREDTIYEEFSDLNDKVFREGLNYTRLIAYSGFNLMDTMRLLISLLALLLFGYSSLTGNLPLSIGMLYVFINYMTQAFDHMASAVLRAGELEKATVAADHIFELLHLPEEKYGQKEPAHIEGRVAFEDISFAYDGENYVLKDINFQVDLGQSVAFVGHTGSGKSTIMNLLFGFYRPQKGKISIDQMDISQYNMMDLRKEMSIVLQDPYLFTGSLKDNISLFNQDISESQAKAALIEVGGQEILDKLEDGLDTRVREAGGGLSAGERQLISFARAIVTKPKILVLDEATSNIDTETEGYIQRGIEKLKEGRTTFLIAHRLSTIKDVDRIYVLDKGRIVEEGSHDQLISAGGIYMEMYKAQSSQENKG